MRIANLLVNLPTFEDLEPNPGNPMVRDCNGDRVVILPLGPDECIVCGESADWVSLSFLAPVCSPDCLAEMWAGDYSNPEQRRD